MKAVYFAWVRERVGKAEEDISPPSHVIDVAGLLAWLAARDEGNAHAFENPKLIRVAIDRAHVKHDASIAGARDILSSAGFTWNQEGALLDPTVALDHVALPPGSYLCRVVKLGGPRRVAAYRTYPPFFCYSRKRSPVDKCLNL